MHKRKNQFQVFRISSFDYQWYTSHVLLFTVDTVYSEQSLLNWILIFVLTIFQLYNEELMDLFDLDNNRVRYNVL